MATFDAKRVTPLEWTGIGAGAVAFIASFLPWYSVSFDVGPLAGIGGFGGGGSVSAWNVGIGGWLPVLLLVACAVLIVLPHVGTAVPNGTVIWLGLAGLALVVVLIRWLTLPGEDGPGFSQGAGFGLIIGIIAALASAAAGGLAFRSSQTTTA